MIEFDIGDPNTLRVVFDDGTEQVIDFRPVLEGLLYGPLWDENLVNQVEIDQEVNLLVWPNGVDFDPETLHDWPKFAKEMKRMAKRWATDRSQGHIVVQGGLHWCIRTSTGKPVLLKKN